MQPKFDKKKLNPYPTYIYLEYNGIVKKPSHATVPLRTKDTLGGYDYIY
jgi:hypothetical protein